MANLRNNILTRLDWLTVGLYLFFVFFGWLNIYSATFREGDVFQLFSMDARADKQFVFILAALIVAIIVLIIDSKFWVFFSYPIYGISILLLLLVLIFGTVINGARSWFVLGPVSIQPAEFAKVATVLVVARILSRYGFSIKKWKDLAGAFVIILLPSALVLLQNDTGSSLVYFSLLLVYFREGLNETYLVFGMIAIALFILTLLIPFSVLFALITIVILAIVAFRNSSLKPSLTGLIILALIGGVVFGVAYLFNLDITIDRLLLISAGIGFFIALYVAYKKRIRNLYLILSVWIVALLLIGSVDYIFDSVLEDHQRSRINQVLQIESDPLGSGYNLNQSKIAIGSGGFTGKGFLKGTQTRFDFVPEQSTDFIFCTVGEEWGFLGSALLVIIFGLFLARLIVLAERQRSAFSRIFGYGVFSIFFFHFLINIGMTIGVIPVIGIPLPFFSYGGSSLWSFTVLLFIFLHLDTDRFEVVA